MEETLKKTETHRKKDKQDIIKETQAAWSEELRERASRQDNIIIYGLEEARMDIENGGQRQEVDNTTINELFRAIGANINNEDVKYAVRVGKRSPGIIENPRPIKMGFRCKNKREMIFNRAKNIPSTEFKDVSIAPDLTDQQRDEDKALMAEAERKNEERTEEERLNFEFRCQGRRGERTIIRTRISSLRGRGTMRGQGGQRGRGAATSRARRGSRGGQTQPPPRRTSTMRPNLESQQETENGEEVDPGDSVIMEEEDSRHKRGRSPTEDSPTQTNAAKSSRSR